MAKIIISYRRSDSAAIAGRIRDRLVGRYGAEAVFMDIENIPFGQDFRTHIRDTLLQSDVLIAILGPKWLGRGKTASPRILNETDPVRIEIETALQGAIPIVPVLVDNGRMPEAAEVPASLKDFAFLNAATVDTGRDFHQHMDRLIQALDGIIGKRSAATAAPVPAPAAAKNADAATATAGKPAGMVLIAGAAAAAVVIGLGAIWYFMSPPKPAAVAASQQSTPPSMVTATPSVAAPPTPAVAASAPPAPVVAPTPAPATPAPAPAASAPAAVNASPATLPSPPVTDTAVQALIKPQPDSSGAETGCEQSPDAFRDNFQSERVGWVHLGETKLGSNAYYENGQMVLVAATQNTKWVVLPSLKFKNATICAQIKSPEEASDLGATAGGLVFWSPVGNMDEIYTANVYPDGSYAILRKSNGRWSTITAKRTFDAIRRGLEAENQIKLALRDRVATLYINGTKVQEFEGEPPGDGGVVGLFSRSEADQQNEWHFLNIVVAQ